MSCFILQREINNIRQGLFSKVVPPVLTIYGKNNFFLVPSSPLLTSPCSACVTLRIFYSPQVLSCDCYHMSIPHVTGFQIIKKTLPFLNIWKNTGWTLGDIKLR